MQEHTPKSVALKAVIEKISRHEWGITELHLRVNMLRHQVKKGVRDSTWQIIYQVEEYPWFRTVAWRGYQVRLPRKAAGEPVALAQIFCEHDVNESELVYFLETLMGA